MAGKQIAVGAMVSITVTVAVQMSVSLLMSSAISETTVVGKSAQVKLVWFNDKESCPHSKALPASIAAALSDALFEPSR